MTDIYERLLEGDFILKGKKLFLMSEMPTKTHKDTSIRYEVYFHSIQWKCINQNQHCTLLDVHFHTEPHYISHYPEKKTKCTL